MVGAGLVYLTTVSGAAAGPLTASGTIESIQVDVALRSLRTRVRGVLVEEGQAVAAGDPLLRLDSRLLEAQRASCQAAGDAAVAAAQLEQITAQQALDELYADAPLAAAQAQQALASARDALDDAQRDYTYNQEGNRATSTRSKGAKAKLAVARERMETAKSVYDHTRATLADARRVPKAAYLDSINARNAYNTALSPTTGTPATRRRSTRLSRRRDVPWRRHRSMTPKASWRTSNSALIPMRWRSPGAPGPRQGAAGCRPGQGRPRSRDARPAVGKAPDPCARRRRGGHPRPSSRAKSRSAGAPALSIGQLIDLTITVLPGRGPLRPDPPGRSGRACRRLVPRASASTAAVSRIADRAEFTPRNVQTEEGRRTTVFAVEIAVDDPAGQLKPGMPADVVFRPLRRMHP